MINQLTLLIIKNNRLYSNAYITYKIMLTILVCYGSKLNIIKIYLRWTLFEEILNKLVLLSIKKKNKWN